MTRGHLPLIDGLQVRKSSKFHNLGVEFPMSGTLTLHQSERSRTEMNFGKTLSVSTKRSP